jgi:ferredoxin-type protein NapH
MLKITRWRLLSQILVGVVMVYLGAFGVTKLISVGKFSLMFPTLDCYYYTDSLANCFLYRLQVVLNGIWQHKFADLIILLVMFLAMSAIFGRSWCSWVCPVGLVQDLFSRARSFVKARYFAFSRRWQRATTVTRWSFVFVFFLLSLSIGIPTAFMANIKFDLAENPYCRLCPNKILAPLLMDHVQTLKDIRDPSITEHRARTILTNRVDKYKDAFAVKYDTAFAKVMGYLTIAIFFFFLVTVAFIRRLWCRICPMGAFLGLMNKISFLALKKDGKRCTKCGICQRSCPTQVTEVYEEKVRERIDPSDCTLCYRCVEMCPEKDALKATFFKFPLFRSSYKRFAKSGAVRPPCNKRRSPSEQPK